MFSATLEWVGPRFYISSKCPAGAHPVLPAALRGWWREAGKTLQGGSYVVWGLLGVLYLHLERSTVSLHSPRLHRVWSTLPHNTSLTRLVYLSQIMFSNRFPYSVNGWVVFILAGRQSLPQIKHLWRDTRSLDPWPDCLLSTPMSVIRLIFTFSWESLTPGKVQGLGKIGGWLSACIKTLTCYRRLSESKRQFYH